MYRLTLGAATYTALDFRRSLHLFQETGSVGGVPYEEIRMSRWEQIVWLVDWGRKTVKVVEQEENPVTPGFEGVHPVMKSGNV
jgi:hypothetical protein